MQYRAVLFDWGGVLSVGGTPDELADRVSILLNKTPAATKSLLGPLLSSLKRGTMTVDEFWRKLEAQLGRKISANERSIWAPTATLQPQEKLTVLTKDLQELGYVTGILSNVFPNTAAEIRAAGWYDLYNPVFLSSELGMAKPDKEMYEYAVRELGVGANEIIFVDDQQRCLDPAGELGMMTILAHNAEQIIDDVLEIVK